MIKKIAIKSAHCYDFVCKQKGMQKKKQRKQKIRLSNKHSDLLYVPRLSLANVRKTESIINIIN